MAVLVIADHHDGIVRDSTNKTVTAAQKLSGDIDILVAGKGVDGAAAAAAKIGGVRKVLAADSDALGQGLAEAYEALRAECGRDRNRFADRWRAVAEAWSFEDLNELIRTHNEWYPVERDLPMDLRTRDYVLVNGRSYRRRELDADWILEQFPVSRSRTASAGAPRTPPRP